MGPSECSSAPVHSLHYPPASPFWLPVSWIQNPFLCQSSYFGGTHASFNASHRLQKGCIGSVLRSCMSINVFVLPTLFILAWLYKVWITKHFSRHHYSQVPSAAIEKKSNIFLTRFEEGFCYVVQGSPSSGLKGSFCPTLLRLWDFWSALPCITLFPHFSCFMF